MGEFRGECEIFNQEKGGNVKLISENKGEHEFFSVENLRASGGSAPGPLPGVLRRAPGPHPLRVKSCKRVHIVYCSKIVMTI